MTTKKEPEKKPVKQHEKPVTTDLSFKQILEKAAKTPMEKPKKK